MQANTERRASSVEIVFTRTPDGLVVDQVFVRPAAWEDERPLMQFLQRLRDPELDLPSRARRAG